MSLEDTLRRPTNDTPPAEPPPPAKTWLDVTSPDRPFPPQAALALAVGTLLYGFLLGRGSRKDPADAAVKQRALDAALSRVQRLEVDYAAHLRHAHHQELPR